MRNSLVLLLICLLLMGIEVFVSPVIAANQKVFKPPLTEEQMLDWLKEENYDAEVLPAGRYRIYYLDSHPKGEITQNGSRFTVLTFDWGPRGDIADVVVSSSVELVKRIDSRSSANRLPTFRYHYHIRSLETSRQPVSSFRVNTPDLPRNWHRDISNPPEWGNMGQPYKKRGYNGIAWLHSGETGSYGLLPGASQDGFMFQCQSVPGIIVAHVWAVGRDMNGVEGVRTLHDPQTAPRGPVIGPVAISIDTSRLALTRRLETLTSQSVTLGWLDESAAVPLLQHLADSLSAFGKNRHSQAKREIQSFVQALSALEKQTNKTESPSAEMEKQPPAEPPIIAEALTLLKTNAEYLLTQF